MEGNINIYYDLKVKVNHKVGGWRGSSTIGLPKYLGKNYEEICDVVKKNLSHHRINKIMLSSKLDRKSKEQTINFAELSVLRDWLAERNPQINFNISYN